MFLVASPATLVGPFVEILIAGVPFTFDDSTILILKFESSGSLVELAAEPSAWMSAETYVSDFGATQQRIELAMQQASAAEGELGDPFAYFRGIAVDPAWTGVLALDCGADLSTIGVQGERRAHHIGATFDQVSMLEALSALDHAPRFGVVIDPMLTVVFANSAITYIRRPGE